MSDGNRVWFVTTTRLNNRAVSETNGEREKKIKKRKTDDGESGKELKHDIKIGIIIKRVPWHAPNTKN